MKRTGKEIRQRIEDIKFKLKEFGSVWRWGNHRLKYNETTYWKKLFEEWQDINRTYLGSERARDVRYDCHCGQG